MISSKLFKIEQYMSNSPYYKNLKVDSAYFSNLIVEAPLLEKSTIQQFSPKILNRNYKNMDLNSLNVARTSGSTGEPLEVFWNADDLMKSNLCLWRLRKKIYGIDSSSKYASFHSILYNKSKPLKLEKIMFLNDGVTISFSKFHLNDDDITLYLEAMANFCPEWLLIQPSIAFRLVEYLQIYNTSIPKSVRYIELNGEMISCESENFLKDFFKIPIANMYGCNEINAIGYECLHGNMHILSSNALVQLYNAEIDATGISGDIIVSSLHNSAFPILGYSLGDKVHLKLNYKCPCGNDAPIIDKIYGRKMDEIILNTGKRINPFLFTFCAETVNSMMGNPIKQFKVLHNKEKIVLILRIDSTFNNWKSAICSEIIEICNRELEFIIPLTIKFVDEPIKISENGKFKTIEEESV